MAIGAFPLIKLGALALRQISKPLANHLKAKAKHSEFVRKRICMPPAQFYHMCEVNIKARLLNLGKPKEVVKLNEQAAIELGADLVGEMFMFIVAATTVIFEYTRQSRRSADEKATLDSRLRQIEVNNSDIIGKNTILESRLIEMESKITELEDRLTSRRK